MPHYAGGSHDHVHIKIDWREYFRLFVERHGEPVKHGEHFLLFPDGWRYSSTKHEGPELEPPIDPREKTDLQLTYWHRVKVRLHNELQELEAQLKGLQRLADSRSLPIQHRVVYLGGEPGAPRLQVSESSELDLTGLLAQKEDLVIRNAEATRKIGQYTNRLEEIIKGG